MLNVLVTARQPRALVKINDEIMTGWAHAEWENNSFYSADTFRVTFAVSALPAKRGPDWWAAQKEVFLEVFAGFPVDAENFTTTDLQSQVYGRVDEIAYDPVAQEIAVTGRDLTSVLIDSKTTEKWPNQTGSQIATKLALRYGLTPVVTKTGKLSGTYYQIDHVRLTDERSDWDLLTYLANHEHFAVYVRGKELHFEPEPAPTDIPYMLAWEQPTDTNGAPVYNGKSITFSRDLTVAKGITVTVRYTNIRTKKSDSVSYPKPGKGISAGKATRFGANSIYHFRLANATAEYANQFAEARHREITKHEVKLQAEMPADNLLSTRNLIQVSGTGTAFDQIYYPESIRRSISADEGYTMTIAAKNHAPANEVQL